MTNEEVLKTAISEGYDMAITKAILILHEYKDQILPEAFEEIVHRLKILKS